MGEVYRARDLTLKREVALKVIPDAFAKDEERMARFVREAQMLAALNHVNIAAIYGVEHAAGRRALVLELVGGETLAQVISRGAMPPAEALKIALQIAAAIEAAHEQNIIHRDLKPANIKINSQGLVKVLDFGLARALADSASPTPDPSESPTMTLGGTRAGLILGTAGYMAPEQARGKSVDRRADIWAFGVVLFELLSGHQAFGGETVSDSLAKVLEREPDWSRLPARTPMALRKLIQRCVTKNVRDRLQAIGDARTTLQDLLAEPDPEPPGTRSSKSLQWSKLMPWAVGPLCLAAGWMLQPVPAPPAPPAARFEVPMPSGELLMHQFRHAIDISPDGDRVAFVAEAPASSASSRKLYQRFLDQWTAIPIPGTEGAFNPVYSPDGQSIAFLVSLPGPLETELRKVSLSGGTAVVMGTFSAAMGFTWGPDGSIVVATRQSGLQVLMNPGEAPQPFTELDTAAKEVGHRLPHFLPDGSAVLFTVLRHKEVTPNWSQAEIWVRSIKTGERKRLLENGTDARYAGNGRLVFARMGKLLAVPFDPVSLSVQGSPAEVLDGVVHSLYATSALQTSGAAQYSISANGALAYAPGPVAPRETSEFLWVTRSGVETPVGTKPMAQLTMRLSPDRSKILVNEYSVNADIWTFDLSRGGEIKQTSEGQNAYAIWSPDGSRIAFRSDRSGPAGIYVKSTGSLDVAPLTPGPLDVPASWTTGNQLAFVRADINGLQSDIYVLSVDQPNSERAFLATRFNETYPEFSPDGRWLAYCSNESGRNEVYVRSYPQAGDAVLISTTGGTEPAWSHEGDEIFYRNGTQMMSVRLTIAGTRMTPARPAVLFSGEFGTSLHSRSYDVARDGRFLMRRRVQESAAERQRNQFPGSVRVVLNWSAELQRNSGR
jgi:serine/threonine protein kinase